MIAGSFEKVVEEIHHDVFTRRPHFNRPFVSKAGAWAAKKGASMVGGATAGALVGGVTFPAIGLLPGAVIGFLAGMVAGQVAGDAAGEVPGVPGTILGRLRKKTSLKLAESDVEQLKSNLAGKIDRNLGKLRDSQAKYDKSVKTLQKELGSPKASEDSVAERLQETVRALCECEYYVEKNRLLLLRVSEEARKTSSKLDPMRAQIERDLEALASWYRAHSVSTLPSPAPPRVGSKVPPPLPPKPPARPRP